MSTKITLPLTTGRTKDIEAYDLNEFAIATTVSLSRIYERLRKRSARKMKKPGANGFNAGWLEELEWMPADHKAYLQGVRDALNAVAGRAR